MPNHVTSRLTITGSKKDRDAFLASIAAPDLHIDFNRIVPMPESLSLEAHMGITGAAEAVMGKSRSDNQLIAGLEDINRSRDLLAIKDFDDNEWGEFIVCLNNMRNYGASSWYDWAIKNWGTKWNAYYQSIQRLEGKDIIQFDTAWSDVHGLIAKVAPENLTINYEYADEDTGSNTGVYDYIQGEEIGGPFENGSKQAYNLAFKLNPSSSEYYKLIDGKYEYVEDDE